MVDLLKKYRVHYLQEKMKLLDRWDEGNEEKREFVFSNPDGKPIYFSRPTKWWIAFLEKNNLRKIRFHDLRHTSATLLINQGVHAKIISVRLGHADISTTMNVYRHALWSADKIAAEKFDHLLKNSNELSTDCRPNPQKRSTMSIKMQSKDIPIKSREIRLYNKSPLTGFLLSHEGVL
ncbi:site-specific integrase [Paenibacillus larvae]|uniref:Phage integrase-like protein n=3 Tax=Paenibacillus larvae TaxID=1464 RepID=V9WA75_9BACL|nr:site-specific integrase [Paenibacillus larvae]AHD06032.1 phage integrase-like protein [Paenibacillus larvae subsp. larvae DSM 25430]ETK25769.1 integrase family protein [Paenibacillus larvae subsp. larvae DSM 25719]PCK72340.1 phage integrase-like protein [Paenibacillus larvae subsp. larvae B-3650]AQR76470.1 site-specific integrase [Paenibacillus larvae subsp. larvae]MCY7489760.1 site-specific integrase [Paenibacillus larvae]